ncbi:MAG: 30S ribosomal protein S4 [Candidatus Desantisbacteria bacterium]
MGRYLEAKCKICRRHQAKLFLKGDRCLSVKCGFEKRAYPPGLKGQDALRRKVSDYGIQLREKQKLRNIYGLLETQFRNYFRKAEATPGITGENFLCFLERRLDNVVYRIGWASSRNGAREVVGHGHILVNGKKMNIPSYLVKSQDTIETKRNLQIKEEGLPVWMEKVDSKIRINRFPKMGEMAATINENLIVTFYTR